MDNDKLVILVEPDPNVVFLFELALAQSNISNPVRVLPSPNEALRYLKGEAPFANRELFPLPALLVLDMDYPRSSAAHLVSFVRRTPGLATLPMIGLSEAPIGQRQQNFISLGLNASFHKGHDILEAVSVIQQLDLLREITAISQPAAEGMIAPIAWKLRKKPTTSS
jgi:CheY-like chemotaxis protein